MFTIQTLNKISDVIQEALPDGRYRVSDSVQSPDAVLVRSASMHDMPVPDSLLAVARAGAGVNNIPVADYTQRGICVFNTPGANANAVAELVILGMLISGRKVVEGIKWAASLKGQEGVAKLVEKGKGQFVGPELRGKTLGVIGLGAIGALVANAAAQGLGMRVLGLDPYLSVQHAWSLSRAVKRAPNLETLLQESDFITLHVPLSDATRAMFNAELLSQLKPDAHLLNFSRAELVDGAAVRAALAQGRLATYVTDFPTDDMLGVEGVICIPHLGASTPESEENCARMAAEQVRDYMENGSIHNSVNLPEIELGRPEGTRLLIIHDNAPGLLNSIASVISREKINIVSMLNKSRGEVAVTALDVDRAPDDALLDEMAALPQIKRVRRVTE